MEKQTSKGTVTLPPHTHTYANPQEQKAIHKESHSKEKQEVTEEDNDPAKGRARR